MATEESKISNTEWSLVIGALLMIDLAQMVLEWLVIGLVINPFIDIFVGMSLALYLQLRGQSLANPKRLFGLIGTFVGELIPLVDELPLWCLDGVFNMLLSKSDKILEKVPGAKVAVSVANSVARKAIAVAAPEAVPILKAADTAMKVVNKVSSVSKGIRSVTYPPSRQNGNTRE